MQNGSISCQINQLYPVISAKHIFRKRNRRIQRTNTKLKSSNNSIVNTFSRNSSSLQREVLPSVVEALHCSDFFQLAEVRTSPCLRRITGLVQHCAWPCQGVRVPVALSQMSPPVGIRDLQYMSGLEVSACSIDTELNYDKI